MSQASPINVAVVGATGIVGLEFLKILQDKQFPVGKLRLFASEKTAGESLNYNGKKHPVEELKPGCFEDTKIAFFSAGTDVSLKWAPEAIKSKCFVIDNSSAFRMNPDIALVVPEVNAQSIPNDGMAKIIANPNCSTIQLVVVLKPLSDRFGLKNVIVSTYQSVSGAGRNGVEELLHQTTLQIKGAPADHPKAFKHNIAFNNIPQIDVFDPHTGFTLEELKVIKESRKILNLPHLDISCTAVRTPTINGHSEAVWVELNKPTTREEMIALLSHSPGIVVADEPDKSLYPLNREASGKDPVYVGRIRQDLGNPNRWLLWIVADNVRKGAALNGLQIATKLVNLY